MKALVDRIDHRLSRRAHADQLDVKQPVILMLEAGDAVRRSTRRCG
jgi:hypothetical protein